MKNAERKLEVFANAAIVIVALALLAVLGHRLFTSNSTDSAELKAGDSFALPQTDWAGNKNTLVLVLQKGCHFCAESASFYQKLTAAAHNRRGLQIMAVLPTSVDESKSYLRELGVGIEEVRQTNLGSAGIRGTPTLVLVDGQGKINASWVGKLTPVDEEKVLQKITATNREL